jgi:hypothetical protein
MPSSDHFQREARNEGFTPNNVWASNLPEGSEEELTTPSGQTCRARRVTPQSMIATGLLSQVDTLTAVVDKHTRQIKGGNKVADGPVLDQSLMTDPDAMVTMFEIADRVMPHILVSPPVVMHFTETVVGKTKVKRTIPAEERKPGTIYTDMIDLEDKMFLFDWAMGGLAAFSTFRRDSDSDVGDVANREERRGKAKRRSGRN